MLGEPDPLEPDDQHELQPTSPERGQKSGNVAGGEGADAEQAKAEHRRRHLGLDVHEQGQHGQATEYGCQHPRVGPAGWVAPVGQEGVHNPAKEGDEADSEGGVAQPVDAGRHTGSVVLQHEVRPDRPEEPEGHRYQKDQVPLDGPKEPPQHEADERPRDGRYAIYAHGLAPLVGGEGVGQDST